jgi:hypothetical protein
MTESFPNPMTSTPFLSAFLLQEQRLPDLASLRTETVFLAPPATFAGVGWKNAGVSTVAIVAPRETVRDAARGELFRVLGRHNLAEPKGNARKRFRMGDLEKARGDRPASVIPNFDVVFIFRSA